MLVAPFHQRKFYFGVYRIWGLLRRLLLAPGHPSVQQSYPGPRSSIFLMVLVTTTLPQSTAVQKASSILKNICTSSFENIFCPRAYLMNIRSVFRVSSCHWKLSSFNIAKICYVAILIVCPLALSLPNSRRHFSYAKVQHFGTARRHFLSTLLAFTQVS